MTRSQNVKIIRKGVDVEDRDGKTTSEQSLILKKSCGQVGEDLPPRSVIFS